MVFFRACRLLGSLLVAIAGLGPLMALAQAAGRERLASDLQIALCRLLLWGLRLRASGSLASLAPALLVANHVSWLDILVIGSRTRVSFLAKREVAEWPLVGLLARLQGTVFVDRARRRSILPANAAITARLAGGSNVALFAEGTTSDGVVLPFRTSHLAALRGTHRNGPKTAAIVLPIAIAYSHPVAAWVGDESLLPHLWRVLTAPPLQCILRAGEVRTVRPGFDRKALGRALRLDVSAMLADARVIPPNVLSSPDGGVAAGMLVSIFVTALSWTVLTGLFEPGAVIISPQADDPALARSGHLSRPRELPLTIRPFRATTVEVRVMRLRRSA